jgi:uridylate kinase
MYKRILLKLSGEQLTGSQDHGIDPAFVEWLATEIKKAFDNGTQVAIVVGGGNWLRGAAYASHGIERATADYMGMLATVMNGLALMDMLEHHGTPVRLQSNLRMEQVAEPFIRRRAIRHMEKGRVVIIAGGTGKPYVTTDTAAVNAALELGCEAVLKATKVDGIYDKDPAKHKDAVKQSELTHQEALESPSVKVMDKAALGMAADADMPIVVFKLEEDAIASVASGEPVGTRVGQPIQG